MRTVLKHGCLVGRNIPNDRPTLTSGARTLQQHLSMPHKEGTRSTTQQLYLLKSWPSCHPPGAPPCTSYCPLLDDKEQLLHSPSVYHYGSSQAILAECLLSARHWRYRGEPGKRQRQRDVRSYARWRTTAWGMEGPALEKVKGRPLWKGKATWSPTGSERAVQKAFQTGRIADRNARGQEVPWNVPVAEGRQGGWRTAEKQEKPQRFLGCMGVCVCGVCFNFSVLKFFYTNHMPYFILRHHQF